MIGPDDETPDERAEREYWEAVGNMEEMEYMNELQEYEHQLERACLLSYGVIQELADLLEANDLLKGELLVETVDTLNRLSAIVKRIEGEERKS
jgi:hypothetical protein